MATKFVQVFPSCHGCWQVVPEHPHAPAGTGCATILVVKDAARNMQGLKSGVIRRKQTRDWHIPQSVQA